MRLLTPLIEFLLPSLCMVCERVQSHLVCSNCLLNSKRAILQRAWTCTICGIPVAVRESRCLECVKNPPAYDATLYIDSYTSKLQHALHAYKYQSRLACAAGFSYLWNQCADMLSPQIFADYLLPVPLGVSKLSRRGFNQSWEIARNIQVPKTVRKIPDAIGRRGDEAPQATLNRVMRKEKMEGIFYLNTNWCGRFKDRTVIVFDDVMTSGATMNAIAALLKREGAKHVSAWVVLRTLPNP
jgi:ComF family protein